MSDNMASAGKIEEPEYLSIADDYMPPRESPDYQGLRKPKKTELPAEITHKRRTCIQPPWWGWLLIVAVITVIAMLAVLLHILLTSNMRKPENPLNAQLTQVRGQTTPGPTYPKQPPDVKVIPTTRQTTVPSNEPRASTKCVVDAAILIDAYHGGRALRTQSEWVSILNFVTSIIRLLPIGNQTTHLGLAAFAREGHVFHSFSDEQEKNELEKRLWVEKWDFERRYTYKGLQVVRNEIFNQSAADRVDRPNILVVITHGNQNSGFTQALGREVILMHQIAEVVSIGITGHVSEETLALLASDPNLIIRVPNFTMLTTITDKVIDLICNTKGG